jgi:hypothetical protein
VRAPALVTVEERLTRKTGLSPPDESVRFTLVLSKPCGVTRQRCLETHFSPWGLPALTKAASALPEAFLARYGAAWPSQARPQRQIALAMAHLATFFTFSSCSTSKLCSQSSSFC